jgi:hypothetical protein
MTLKNMLSTLLANFAPLGLTKPINPAPLNAAVFTQTNQDSKPWLNADDIELTSDDFA